MAWALPEMGRLPLRPRLAPRAGHLERCALKHEAPPTSQQTLARGTVTGVEVLLSRLNFSSKMGYPDTRRKTPNS